MAKKPTANEGDAEAFEWAARELYEADEGMGSWTAASTAERSKARHKVRVVLATYKKHGYELAAPKPAKK